MLDSQHFPQVMNGLCLRKETMTLKNMCNSIVRKPGAMDIMLLFQTPSGILQPLCALLDGWRWDDDHGKQAHLRIAQADILPYDR